MDPPETMSRRFNNDDVKNSGTGNQEARVVLKVKGHQDGSEVYFNIGRSTKLRKLMYVYCLRQGQKFVSFMLNGRLLRGDETADQLKMKEGDEIKAFVHETFRDQVTEWIALAEKQRKDEERREERRSALIAKIGRMVSERIAKSKRLKEELKRLWNDGEEDGVFLMIGRLVCEVMIKNDEIMEEAGRLYEEDKEYDEDDDDEVDEGEDAKFIELGRLATELWGWEELVGREEKKLHMFSRL